MIRAEILEQLNTTEELMTFYLGRDVHEIFHSMTGTKIFPVITTDTETVFSDCFTAMVGFAGSYNGILSINTPRKVAHQITSEMLGMEVTDSDVRDALGEIANITAGSFKRHYATDGHEVSISTPSIISSGKHSMSIGMAPDTLTIKFDYCSEHFVVCLCLEAGE